MLSLTLTASGIFIRFPLATIEVCETVNVLCVNHLNKPGFGSYSVIILTRMHQRKVEACN